MHIHGIRALSLIASNLPRTRHLSLSVAQGALHPPLDSRTLGDYFAETIRSRLTRPALICSQESPRPHGGPVSENMGVTGHLKWDFAEFNKHIQALARGLVELGVKRGDRIAVVMGNNRFVPGFNRRRVTLTAMACQRVHDASVGMCKHRCHSRYSQPCISCARASACTMLQALPLRPR
jgi:acyl-CoA synthetase (AMP-forming)/AMP-acid ligase II